MTLRQKKDVFDQIKLFLESKTIRCVPDLFLLIKYLVEYVEKYNFLLGYEKKDLVFESLRTMLYKTCQKETASNYVNIIIPYIEDLIISSRSKLIINNKFNRSCLKTCL